METTAHHSTTTATGLVDLREREKELDFVYGLALLLSAADLDEVRVASQTAGLFREALTRPELVEVRVGINGITAISSPIAPSRVEVYPTDTDVRGNHLKVSAGEAGNCWIEAVYWAGTVDFSDRELSLGESAVRLLEIAAGRMVSDRRDEALKLDLERKNATLSELLSRIELEKKTIRDGIAARLMERVLPLLARFDAAGVPSGWTAEIRREMEQSVAGTSAGSFSLRSLLTNREMEICTLVADGLSSKEIADHLGLALATVERHRHNARRKLGFPARQGSLGSIPASLDL
jgi:DNA-binding CsgD family transcriptional regulator